MRKFEASHSTSGMVRIRAARGYLETFPKMLGKRVVTMKAGRPRLPRYWVIKSG